MQHLVLELNLLLLIILLMLKHLMLLLQLRLVKWTLRLLLRIIGSASQLRGGVHLGRDLLRPRTHLRRATIHGLTSAGQFLGCGDVQRRIGRHLRFTGSHRSGCGCDCNTLLRLRSQVVVAGPVLLLSDAYILCWR